MQRIVLTFLCLLVVNTAPFAYGADLLSKLHPYISLKEEYSDNLNLAPINKKKDSITTVQPGIKFSSMGTTAGIDLDYSLGAVFYGKQTNLNYLSHNASMNAKYLTSEHINFYLKESFIQSDDPREREYFTTGEDNKYVLATTTDRAIYWRNVVAPTLEYQFGPENRLGVNYRNNIYRTASESGQNSQEDYINPFFSYWFNKQNGIYLEYGYTDGKFDKNPDLAGHRANARYTNRFEAKSSAFAEYTYSRRSYAEPDNAATPVTPDYDIHESNVGLTVAVTPALTASSQVGYFWTKPSTGEGKSGFSYKGELAGTDPRTTYKLSAQGGYTEDLFTSENLGFSRYHRLTGSLNHLLDKRLSIGCMGSIERAEYDPDRSDKIWSAGGNASYMPLKWLTLALEASHKNRKSTIELNEYTENRGMFRITATY